MNLDALKILKGLSPALAAGGRPDRILPHGGLPAFESETGALLVMESLIAFGGGATHPPMLLPRSYGAVADRAPSGLTALHDEPDAIWSWRPLLYSLLREHTERLGSQHELEYRWGLAEIGLQKADLQEAITLLGEWCAKEGKPHSEYVRLANALIDEWYEAEPIRVSARVGANTRARELLLENLAPQQRIDLTTRGGFFARGEVNPLYFVEVGNGLSIVDPKTHVERVSLCLHPESWIPHDDVALATKLALDAGRDAEAELLEAARPYPRKVRRREPTLREQAAYRLECRWAMSP